MRTNFQNKRYTFRLTDDDIEVYHYLESSNKPTSETIRELLRFAISMRKIGDKDAYFELKNELIQMKEILENLQLNLINKTNTEITVSDPTNLNNNNSVNEILSIENSIDSMFDVFGIEDD